MIEICGGMVKSNTQHRFRGIRDITFFIPRTSYCQIHHNLRVCVFVPYSPLRVGILPEWSG